MNVKIFSSSSLQYCSPKAMHITRTTHNKLNANKFLAENNMFLSMRFSRKLRKFLLHILFGKYRVIHHTRRTALSKLCYWTGMVIWKHHTNKKCYIKGTIKIASQRSHWEAQGTFIITSTCCMNLPMCL